MRLGHDMVHALVPRDLGQIRRVHDAFHRVFTAPDQATAVRTVNAMLSQTRVTARLTEHDGHPLHLLAQGEAKRLSTCSASDCNRGFVDESRNRSRVYCDGRTRGNRTHVAAYHARRRA